MAALIIGTLLALAALAYVLYPLFADPALSPDASGLATPSSAPDDVVEAEIRRARGEAPACSTCGPRPELDAVYCSNCGKYLPGRCPGCGRPPTEPGAQFCANCGHNLAA